MQQSLPNTVMPNAKQIAMWSFVAMAIGRIDEAVRDRIWRGEFKSATPTEAAASGQGPATRTTAPSLRITSEAAITATLTAMAQECLRRVHAAADTKKVSAKVVEALLASHPTRQHPDVCVMCTRKFTSRDALLDHMVTAHTNLRPNERPGGISPFDVARALDVHHTAAIRVCAQGDPAASNRAGEVTGRGATVGQFPVFLMRDAEGETVTAVCLVDLPKPPNYAHDALLGLRRESDSELLLDRAVALLTSDHFATVVDVAALRILNSLMVFTSLRGENNLRVPTSIAFSRKEGVMCSFSNQFAPHRALGSVVRDAARRRRTPGSDQDGPFTTAVEDAMGASLSLCLVQAAFEAALEGLAFAAAKQIVIGSVSLDTIYASEDNALEFQLVVGPSAAFLSDRDDEVPPIDLDKLERCCIPPEGILGVWLPSSDVYALGVTLYLALTFLKRDDDLVRGTLARMFQGGDGDYRANLGTLHLMLEACCIDIISSGHAEPTDDGSEAPRLARLCMALVNMERDLRPDAATALSILRGEPRALRLQLRAQEFVSMTAYTKDTLRMLQYRVQACRIRCSRAASLSATHAIRLRTETGVALDSDDAVRNALREHLDSAPPLLLVVTQPTDFPAQALPLPKDRAVSSTPLHVLDAVPIELSPELLASRCTRSLEVSVQEVGVDPEATLVANLCSSYGFAPSDARWGFEWVAGVDARFLVTATIVDEGKRERHKRISTLVWSTGADKVELDGLMYTCRKEIDASELAHAKWRCLLAMIPVHPTLCQAVHVAPSPENGKPARALMFPRYSVPGWSELKQDSDHAYRLLRDVASALSHLHNHGFAHGRIGPDFIVAKLTAFPGAVKNSPRGGMLKFERRFGLLRPIAVFGLTPESKAVDIRALAALARWLAIVICPGTTAALWEDFKASWSPVVAVDLRLAAEQAVLNGGAGSMPARLLLEWAESMHLNATSFDAAELVAAAERESRPMRAWIDNAAAGGDLDVDG